MCRLPRAAVWGAAVARAQPNWSADGDDGPILSAAAAGLRSPPRPSAQIAIKALLSAAARRRQPADTAARRATQTRSRLFVVLACICVCVLYSTISRPLCSTSHSAAPNQDAPGFFWSTGTPKMCPLFCAPTQTPATRRDLDTPSGFVLAAPSHEPVWVRGILRPKGWPTQSRARIHAARRAHNFCLLCYINFNMLRASLALVSWRPRALVPTIPWLASANKQRAALFNYTRRRQFSSKVIAMLIVVLPLSSLSPDSRLYRGPHSWLAPQLPPALTFWIDHPLAALPQANLHRPSTQARVWRRDTRPRRREPFKYIQLILLLGSSHIVSNPLIDTNHRRLFFHSTFVDQHWAPVPLTASAPFTYPAQSSSRQDALPIISGARLQNSTNERQDALVVASPIAYSSRLNWPQYINSAIASKHL